jgi:hypothetical protein
MPRLSERQNIVFLVDPQNHQSAGIDGDSFHVGRLFSFSIVVQFGELTGNAVMSLYSGATNGTKTTQERFRYRLADAELKTATGDQWGDLTTIAAGAGLTLTAATYEDKELVIEMEGDEFTDGQPWITLEFTSAASELFVSAVMVGEPRFRANDPVTVIT